MNRHQVDISPDARAVLYDWVERCEEDNGIDVANDLIDAYESMISILEDSPLSGTGRLQDIPSKYRAIHLWRHLWAIYQVYERKRTVKVEYIIDDRQNYRIFVI